MDDHVISCVLIDIPSQINGVLWNPATESRNEYTLEDGTISGISQTSKLTISAAKLLNLKSSSATHAFTCKITVGISKIEVNATQTITIYYPSKTNQTYSIVKTEMILIANYKCNRHFCTEPSASKP